MRRAPEIGFGMLVLSGLLLGTDIVGPVLNGAVALVGLVLVAYGVGYSRGRDGAARDHDRERGVH